jgi:hypothetical protein
MGSFRIFETMSKAIEADPEPWNAPHREAMAWYDYRDRFQGFVVDQNAIHSFISSHIRSWEQGIEDGTIEYTSEDEERYLSICRSLRSMNWSVRSPSPGLRSSGPTSARRTIIVTEPNESPPGKGASGCVMCS